MRNGICFFILLSTLLFLPFEEVRGQMAENNNGNILVYPSTNKFVMINHINAATGIEKNNGTIYYLKNFDNEGIVNYDSTLFINPGQSRFEGTVPQTISGAGTTRFKSVLFTNQLIAEAITLQQNIHVSTLADYTNGIVTAVQATPESMTNMVIMESGSSVANVSDKSFEDGFVQKAGNNAFTFPIGNGGYYRPASISAPSFVTDTFSARYIAVNPDNAGYSRNTTNTISVSSTEYWVVKRTHGTSMPQVTLSWDVNKTSDPQLSYPNVVIVRWNGSKWIEENTVLTTGTSSSGTVTANVTGYGVFTLASVSNPSSPIILPTAVNYAYTVAENASYTGDVSVKDTPGSVGGNTWKVVINSVYGAVTMNANGGFTYTPETGYTGSDSFTYSLTDASGNSSTAIVTMNVQPASTFLVVEKYSGKVTMNADGTYSWKYTIVLNNHQSVKIDAISITDDLTKVFASPITYTVTGITATGNLVSNGLYDGSNYTNTLSSTQDSWLAATSKDSIMIEMKVDAHGFTGNVYNQAIFSGTSTFMGNVTGILSDDSTNTAASYPRPTITYIPEAFFIPDAFSPNGDGIDDYFVIKHSDGLKLNIQVYNRWGELVYRSTDYQNNWDGKGVNSFLGKDLPEGTYYYILLTTDASGDEKKYSGFITLRR
jgi:gliding motility-associated-like protein